MVTFIRPLQIDIKMGFLYHLLSESQNMEVYVTALSVTHDGALAPFLINC